DPGRGRAPRGTAAPPRRVGDREHLTPRSPTRQHGRIFVPQVDGTPPIWAPTRPHGRIFVPQVDGTPPIWAPTRRHGRIFVPQVDGTPPMRGAFSLGGARVVSGGSRGGGGPRRPSPGGTPRAARTAAGGRRCRTRSTPSPGRRAARTTR